MIVDDILTRIGLSSPLSPAAMWTAMLLLNLVVFLIVRYFIARGLVYLAQRTKNKYDDIIVAELRPYRFTWIAPLLLTYYLADQFPEATEFIRQGTLVLILWLVIITLNSLLNAVNSIYESRKSYTGLSIQGYLDLGKILLLLIGVILTASMITRQSPVILLSGLGAAMALLVLIFRDTLLSFVASLQIQSSDLLREGDWIEMPAYGADGEVLNIALHTVRIQNWDKTITVIPTHKLLDTPYKNWRGMEESGGRRIKRAITIDLNTIRFCDEHLLDRLKRIDLLSDYLEQYEKSCSADADSLFSKRQLTNAGVFRAYVLNYLKSRPDLHKEGMTLLVRQLEPGPSGLPLEVYAFSKTVDWVEYEGIQADIFEHLVAAIPQFDLRIFQQPTGVDFRALATPESEAGTPTFE